MSSTGVMPIPCPHFKITIVKRSQGQSAVAGAAYQSGERLFSEYDQKTKSYNKKKELVHAEIMLPPHASPGYADRATLWNAVDKFFLLVVKFRFLVILAEQPFAALVSGSGNSGLSLAALDDGNFEMRTRNRHHPLMTFESFTCKNHELMVLLA